jgi:hypothetical protein
MVLLCARAAAADWQIVADNQWSPEGIAVDEKSIYWTNVGAQTVMRVAKSGGKPVVLADRQPSPYGIAVDAKSIYWIDWGPGPQRGVVMILPKRGGKPRVLAEAAGDPIGQEIAVDDTHVYFTRGKDLVRVAKSGGAVGVIASGVQTVTSLALDGTHVYAASADTEALVRAPKSGGPLEVLAKPQMGRPLRVAVDDQYIYYTVSGTFSGKGVLKLPKGSREAVEVTPRADPSYLAVDMRAIYFAPMMKLEIGKPLVPILSAQPKKAAEPIELMRGPVVRRMAWDDKALYFTEGVGDGGTILKLPRPF